jgi:hypothetical protein
VIELVGVLLVHGFGALTWSAFMAFAADAGSSRDLFEAFVIGAATWLATTILIVWLWRSARSPYFWFVPFAWWYPSWLLAFTIAYGPGVWNEAVSFGYVVKPSSY